MVRRPVRRYRRSGSRALISGGRDVQLVDLRHVCDFSAAKSKDACIDAPAELVWARLAKLEDIELWSHLIKRATCPGERSRGVGAERTCELAGNITILERWVAWDEGRSFA
jgi:hypothetical protein